MSLYPFNPNVGQEIQAEADTGLLTDRAFIAHRVWTGPAVADEDLLLVDQATSSSVITVVTTFLAQPDVPRNIEVLPGGVTADVPAGDVTIAGTDIDDQVLSEAVTFAADATTKQVTASAFKTVTTVTFPIQDGAGATYDVGTGDLLGLKRALSHNTVLATFLNNTLEGTAPTVAVSASVLAENTVDLNSALDTNQVDVYYLI